VDHEQVIPTLGERFVVIVAVDVVFYFASAHGVCGIRFGWWRLVDSVANSVQPVIGLSVSRCGEGKKDGRKRDQPPEVYGCSPSKGSSTSSSATGSTVST
jgi:hypothetical protein